MSDKKSKKDMMIKNLSERQNEAKTVRKIVLITILSILAAIIIVGLALFFYINSALKPVDPDNDKFTSVEIPIGSSPSSISHILKDHGIVKNARVFKYYVKFNNEGNFQAGNYQLSPSMTLDELVKTLKSGKLVKKANVKILVPEGKQLKEIAKIIADETGQDNKKIFETLNDPAFIKKMQAKFPDLLTQDINGKNIKHPLEGYLFPATYEYYEDNPSLETIVSDMLRKTSNVMAKYLEQMAAKKFTIHKLLTVASLVEEEATQQTDRGKIAQVFYNRIQEGMPLQTDPTVLYALGEHKKRVLYSHLEVDDPYNTYKNKGFPPGPIANAGETSIQAVLNPVKTTALYFLATPEGEVIFTNTLEEHNKAKAEHITSKKDKENKD